MASRHGNIAFFVPHAGCPRQCSFCNQRAISGQQRVPTTDEIEEACRNVLRNRSLLTYELAFFGGSFTAIDESLMLSLLSAAQPFLGDKIVGIRISTRPDCIDERMLALLKANGVTAIELGAQSMDDAVLTANDRGHTAEDVVVASKLIQSFDIELGLQMMTGLYESSFERDVETAKAMIALSPDTVRIYPTIVIEGTTLATRFRENTYRPQTLAQAATEVAELMKLFEEANIPVIRVGLHDEVQLQERMIAGPHHPAFRELCESKIMLERLMLQLPSEKGVYRVAVRPQDVSRMIGQQGANRTTLLRMGYEIKLIEMDNIKPLHPKLLLKETEEGTCV